MVRKALIVVALAWVAIALHEGGHYAAYRLAGVQARMGFQRVVPQHEVPAALATGPAVTLLAALLLLARRGGFAWTTAAFTNASLRLFPLAMELNRALRHGAPFSDEDRLVRSPPVLGALFALFAVLSVVAARRYERPLRTGAAVYALSLVVGIAAILADDLIAARP